MMEPSSLERLFTPGIFCIVKISCMAAQVVSGYRAFLSLFEITWYYIISASYSIGFLFSLLSKICKFVHC